MENELKIKKKSGESHFFDIEKLKRSLQKSGATEEIIEKIAKSIHSNLKQGSHSNEIYQRAFSLLKKHSHSMAARYKLKNAIMELGPSGYPFERFVGEMLKKQGFKTQVGVVVQGKCITHEVDVVAEKDNIIYLVECKYHNSSNLKSDVKVALYIKSRFEDIKLYNESQNNTKEHKGWIFTNTRFSEDAMRYGHCAGLNLVAWDYPSKGNFKEWIDYSGLHPITCLSSINKNEKQKLMAMNVILCSEVLKNPYILDEINLKSSSIKKVMKEIEGIFSHL